MTAESSANTMERVTDSEDETTALAAMLARQLQAGDVVALSGELGAGKTRFVRGLARGLGLDESAVCSPTFVIVHEYENRSAGAESVATALIHVDAYRIRSEDDLVTIGWNEMLDSADAVIAVEWPERIARAMPADRLDVTIEHGEDESRRRIVLEPRGALARRRQSWKFEA